MTSYQVNTLQFWDLAKSGASVSVLLFYVRLFNVTACLSHHQHIQESAGFLFSVTKTRHIDLMYLAKLLFVKKQKLKFFFYWNVWGVVLLYVLNSICLLSSYFAEQLWSKYQDPPCAHELSRDCHYRICMGCWAVWSYGWSNSVTWPKSEPMWGKSQSKTSPDDKREMYHLKHRGLPV